MKTYVHLWQYLAELSLIWDIYQTKFVEEIKSTFFIPKVFSP